MIRSAAVIVAFVSLFAASNAVGQYTSGSGTPGSGGLVPRIAAEQAWLGRSDWTLSIQNGLGGAQVRLLWSAAPGGTMSPMTLSRRVLSLGGPPGVAGAGSMRIDSVIPAGPRALIGAKIYIKAVIFDYANGAPASTPLLEVEITDTPLVFVGQNISGSNDAHWLIDPVAGNLKAGPVNGVNDNVKGAVFADAGKNLYVMGSVANVIMRADFSGGGAPVWSTFFTFTGTSIGIQYDRNHRILWAIGNTGVGPEINAIDADPDSATYGQLLGSTTGLTTYTGSMLGVWALSPSGKLAVVPDLLGNGVHVFDTDPDSPGFLQYITTFVITSGPGSTIWLNSALAVSPDDDQILVWRLGTSNTPAEVARFSFSGAGAIDHDPVFPGVQNMGAFANPPIVLPSGPSSTISSPFGDTLIAAGPGGGTDPGWIGRLDYDTSNPSVYGFTFGSGTTIPEAYYCTTSPDGSMAAVTSVGSVDSVKFFDTATMTFQFQVALPGLVGSFGSNASQLGWR